MKIYRKESGFKDFAKKINLSTPDTQRYSDSLNQSFMPFMVTDHYAKLIREEEGEYKNQLINIVLPSLGAKPFKGRFDPYGNKSYRQDSYDFIQHKYKNTLLLHIDNFCISNCQFCYKVYEIRHEETQVLTLDNKIDIALDYLDKNPDINNVLFTGGDPAAFRKTKQLVNLIKRLIQHKNIRIVRFATKGLSYNPERFLDEDLLNFFKYIDQLQNKQVSIIAQINHPAEIDEKASIAIKAIQKTGVQVRGQPAIIKGVNDSIETLIDLQRKFLDNKIISYYLTVFMPVRGVEQYALKLHKAYINVSESKRNLSGLEKKGILLTSHDFGKFEIVGFIPSPEKPQQIILKWHEAAMPKYLPKELCKLIATRPEDTIVLDYNEDDCYCIDHIFKLNNLPYYNEEGELII
jgi:KamA family protein